MEWLLTEKEIDIAEREAMLTYRKYHPFATADYHESILVMRKAIAKAQAKKLVEWLQRKCLHEHNRTVAVSGELVVNGITVGLFVDKKLWNDLVEEVCFGTGVDMEWDAKEPV
jgi:hypothetical protein